MHEQTEAHVALSRVSTDSQKTHCDQSDEEPGKEAEDIVEAKNVGLQLFTTIEKGWLRTNFTAKDLVNDLQASKIKFTYEDNLLDDEEIYKTILTNRVILKGCWNKIEKEEFRKLRSGLVKDRSPLKRRNLRARSFTHYE